MLEPESKPARNWSGVSTSDAQTEALGAALADVVPSGTVIALYGDLAAGKTCLVRGMARSFGAMENVHSPTFTLVNIYGDAPRQLFHLDLYRLASKEELHELGCEELFEPAGLCVVEWAERAAGLLPIQRVEIHLSHGGADKREITVTAPGELVAELEKSLAIFWG